jgi:hypothetical protein
VITLLVMTDGRHEYIERTLASAMLNLKGDVSLSIIHDDSGDPEYNRWLHDRFPDYDLIGGGERLGQAGAIRRAWRYLEEWDTNRFTFHLEDDFVFNRPVDLDELAEFLDQKWWLAQVALRRGRWGSEAGGFVEDSPSAYIERTDSAQTWLEHRLYYTLTPHLYRARLRRVGWPEGPGGEVYFRDRLFREGLPWDVQGKHVQFAFWGGVVDGADAVTHIGERRMGHGY